MYEIVINLHMHTRYSDGSGTHKEIAAAALQAGLDAVIVTDHNTLVQGVEGYYRVQPRRVLLLVGQEVHDQARQPQKNHLLVFNAERDLAVLADDPQKLIDGARQAGGLCFIAHPDDPAAPAFNETDITWEDWDAQNYTGIELWNGLSELKTVIPTKLHGLFYAFFPQLVGRGPLRKTLERWDVLLAQGRPVAAIGGSDAHALRLSLGPLHRTIYPYEFHFRAVNTHALIPQPLTGDVVTDKKMIYEALAAGRCFVAYDLPAPTRGFAFKAKGLEQSAIMGEEISVEGGVTLHAHAPQPADIHLLKDGQSVGVWKNSYAATYSASEPGVYRVEVYRKYLGKQRGWIFSNPIYVK